MGNKDEIETLDLGVSKAGTANKNTSEVKEETVKNEDVTFNSDLVKEETVEKKGDLEESFIGDDSTSSMFGSDLADLKSSVDNGFKEKKSLSKVIIVIVVLLLFVGIAFALYIWDNNRTEQLEETMKVASLDYFDKYMSANTGAGAYVVTLEKLRDANKAGETYNLQTLEKCSDETEAIISIDYATGKVSKTEIRLNCKKF